MAGAEQARAGTGGGGNGGVEGGKAGLRAASLLWVVAGSIQKKKQLYRVCRKRGLGQAWGQGATARFRVPRPSSLAAMLPTQGKRRSGANGAVEHGAHGASARVRTAAPRRTGVQQSREGAPTFLPFLPLPFLPFLPPAFPQRIPFSVR